ncbi:MAG: hypothetical protein PHE50_00550 [Dehalococcoidales bacterium]|nr:hypothetical protein [Dehalococcoidales bacterium]
MDYPFENLDPERFQQLCQSLLTKEFSNVQCLPVAQPDGGRDALQYTSVKGQPTKFIIYQVKFVRRNEVSRSVDWITKILSEEIPKVKKLLKTGIMQYVLITNQNGTSHLNNGSIDKANQLFAKQIGIPFICWWRDDLNRRLDNSWDLKCVYPELLTGPDFMRYYIEGQGTSDQQRRNKAIRAFISEQYMSDQQVKFKQIDLQNNLMSLYIDVPVVLSSTSSQYNKQHSVEMTLYNVQRDSTSQEMRISQRYVRSARSYMRGVSRGSFTSIDDADIGLATLLLHPKVQVNIPHCVIEGAPGQGKSTIVQYICQIHRSRLLGYSHDIESLPLLHTSAPVRIPIKVDIRDFSAWLAGRNPFSAFEGDKIPNNWKKSLESFLAAKISHYSGGMDFSVDDLVSVITNSPTLIVFDGLDEVADMATRQEVVNHVVVGINRLEANSGSIQVVVTSRPAAFVSSPTFPPEKFVYFHLGLLNRKLIKQYAEKWFTAKGLNNKERIEVNRILDEKLDQPHLRDLARNPMQLAILLTLVHTRGSSLPDKRTALYDKYMELFFSREAEKSTIVREHRDLLLSIHQYLAWILHSEAESQNSNGSITTERLQSLVSEYLSNEGQDIALTNLLFTGMIERVVALVSRVQGTYEFEVQPLREYFAARYLYDTAPYSPAGNEKKGTKPDRFDAIARDFYWLNVTRFYAGCYSKGELPSLIHCLSDLLADPQYGVLSYPRVLCATLLADWVFTQYPKLVKEVTGLMLSENGLRHLAISNSRLTGSMDPILLPKQCGNQELLKDILETAPIVPIDDYGILLSQLMSDNTEEYERHNLWRDALISSNGKEPLWLLYGCLLGNLKNTPSDEIFSLCKNVSDQKFIVWALVNSGRMDYFQTHYHDLANAIDIILSGSIAYWNHDRTKSVFQAFTYFANPRLYSLFMDSNTTNVFFGPTNTEIAVDELVIEQDPSNTTSHHVSDCLEFIKASQQSNNMPFLSWTTSLDPWNNIIETGRKLWGEHWSFYVIANISASIVSKKITCNDCDDIFDSTKLLCERTRYARLHCNNSVWWAKQSEKAISSSEMLFFLLVLFTWGTTPMIVKLLNVINTKLQLLSDDEWFILFRQLRDSGTLSHRNYSTSSIDIFPNLKSFSYRTLSLLVLRLKPEASSAFVNLYFSKYEGKDIAILQLCQSIAFNNLYSNNGDLNLSLQIIKNSYKLGVVCEELTNSYTIENKELPMDIALVIAHDPSSYPIFLLALAEAKCKTGVSKIIVPVRQIAESDSWFVE